MWFTETPWPPMLICGVLCVILASTFYQRQQSKYLFGALAMLILTGGIWTLERIIITPREKIEAAVYDMTASFQKRETDRTLQYISEQAPQIKMLVTVADNLLKLDDDMRVTDVRTELTNQDTRATSRFRVNATLRARHGSYSQRTPTRWESKWQLEASAWKMIDIQQIDPITGERKTELDSYRKSLPKFPY